MTCPSPLPLPCASWLEEQADENGEVDASKLNSGESGDRAEFGFEPQAGECVNERMNISLKEAVEGALHLLRISLVGAKTRTWI